jgi:hypothetical protein
MDKVYLCHKFQQSVKPHTTEVVDVNLSELLIRKSDARLQNILIGSRPQAL